MGREETRAATQILRAGIFAKLLRRGPRNGGLGESRHRRTKFASAASPSVFWFLFHGGKGTRPAGRNPVNGRPSVPPLRHRQRLFCTVVGADVPIGLAWEKAKRRAESSRPTEEAKSRGRREQAEMLNGETGGEIPRTDYKIRRGIPMIRYDAGQYDIAVIGAGH